MSGFWENNVIDQDTFFSTEEILALRVKDCEGPEGEKCFIPGLPIRFELFEGNKKVQYYSISIPGFRNLTETMAFNFQLDIAGWIDPAYRSTIRNYLQQDSLENYSIYGGIEILLTKYVRKYGKQHFTFNSIHKLITGALFTDIGESFETVEGKNVHLGLFWKFLAEISDRFDPFRDQVKEKNTFYDKSINNWESVVKELKNSLSSYVGSSDPFAHMGKWVIERIIEPAICHYSDCVVNYSSFLEETDLSNKEDLLAMDSSGFYYSNLLNQLPANPISIFNNKIKSGIVNETESLEYFVIWSLWSMQVITIQQMFYKNKLICPWRHSSFSKWIRNISHLLPTRKCQADECRFSRVTLGQVSKSAPRCPWEEILMRFGAIECNAKFLDREYLWFFDESLMDN